MRIENSFFRSIARDSWMRGKNGQTLEGDRIGNLQVCLIGPAPYFG